MPDSRWQSSKASDPIGLQGGALNGDCSVCAATENATFAKEYQDDRRYYDWCRASSATDRRRPRTLARVLHRPTWLRRPRDIDGWRAPVERFHHDGAADGPRPRSCGG